MQSSTMDRMKALREKLVENESVSYRDIIELIDLATDGQVAPPAVDTPQPPSTTESDLT